MPTIRKNYVKEHRRAAGISQEELGRRIDRRLTSINRYESGERGMSPQVIEAVAEALGVESHELFQPPKRIENATGVTGDTSPE